MERNEMSSAIDKMIDQLFFKKSEEVPGQPSEPQKKGELAAPADNAKVKTADSGEKPEEPENEEDGKNGRPKDPSNMGHRDASGASSVDYPESVSSPAMTPPNETTVAKSDRIEISKADFELLQKAKVAQEQATLKKARDEQANLIKSIVVEATKELKSENAQLKKSLDEQSALLKKALSKPMPQKSISSVQVLEKSFGKNNPEAKDGEPESFTKSEMIDAAERLVLRKELPDLALIELEDTGAIYNPHYRALVERELTRKKQ